MQEISMLTITFLNCSCCVETWLLRDINKAQLVLKLLHLCFSVSHVHLWTVHYRSTVGSCVSVCSLSRSLSLAPFLSVCLSLICCGCGPFLRMLKAQLGSQNPLDWCSMASVFHSSVAYTDHLVKGGGSGVCVFLRASLCMRHEW